MRMSNEDFQAEVFRRSAAYQRKQRTRIRILTGAGAFACCLCLTAALGIFMPRLEAAKTFENAATDNTYHFKREEEHAAEINQEAQNAEQADAAPDIAESPEDSEAEDNTAEPAPEYDGPTVFVEKTDEELLDYYGLDSIPAVFNEDIKLMEREKIWGFYLEYPHGLTVAEDDPDIVTDDQNTWLYIGDKRFVYLTLSKWKYGDSETQYDHQDKESEYESITDYAVFAVNGIGVQISYASFKPEDFEDQKMIKKIEQEVRDYLNEHRTDSAES